MFVFLYSEDLTDFLTVIKMVLCLTDNLVVLVPLSGDEDHIARRSQCQCGLYA